MLRAASKAFFKDNFDRFEIRKKWLLFPKLFGNDYYPKERDGWESLDRVFSLRDSIAHNKPVHLNTKDAPSVLKGMSQEKTQQIADIWAYDGESHIRNVLKDLQSIDPKADISWIDHEDEGEFWNMPKGLIPEADE